MALEGQDFLFLSLGDLKLPVDHLRLCVLVGNGARRVGVVTAERERERAQESKSVKYYVIQRFCLFNCKKPTSS